MYTKRLLFYKIALIALSCLVYVLANSQTAPPRKTISFDDDWSFLKEDAKDAEAPDYNDASWRKLSVPHDWSIEGPYDRNNNTGRGGGYLPGGVGWYRKTFTLDDSDAKNSVFIGFDGVMANSDVWINGYHLGKRPNGYISFQYELTGHLNFGEDKKNVIAVRADNSIQPASRWYTGAGIYRHVRLTIANPIHLSATGTFIFSKNISASKASLEIQAQVFSPSPVKDFILHTDIISANGKTVASVETKSTKADNVGELLSQKTAILKPSLWNIDHPQLYKAVVKIIVDKKVVDEITIPFGVRDAKFEAATGFWLNGKNIKIKGVCLHHDGGAVGAAVPLAVWKRRLTLLKELGVNAIRTAHNPPAPEFLDLCDEMGFLVMDETFDTWNAKKNNAEKGYNLFFTDWWEKDTKDIVMRDRNHPSVFIYSVGNEIRDNLDDSSGRRKYKMQQDLIHLLDPSRPVTMALFRPGASHVYENGFADMMDIVGQNYRDTELVAAHQAQPLRKVLGTENLHSQASWMTLRDKPFMAGQFLWTGFDYPGESDWPSVVNGQGLFDKTGGAKNIAWQRKSWWSDVPTVYVMRRQENGGAGDWISDWSPADVDTYDEARLQVFSNCDEVELFLNGKSLGIKTRPADNASPLNWSTTFQKGTLKVVGRNMGKVVVEQELKTARAPAKIILTADKVTIENTWDDVVYITAWVTDENGIVCLNADNKIKFSIEGPGLLTAVDNADLLGTEPNIAKERNAYKGRCIAIVKASAASGNIKVMANTENLNAGVITLHVVAKK
ncbi:MAG: glycoside hydrolase family 2 TIM barrel-domain containing protein [Ferruginibacter sp.]